MPPAALMNLSQTYNLILVQFNTCLSAARELVKEVDYTLRTLSQNLLGQPHMDMPPSQIPTSYQSTEVSCLTNSDPFKD